MATYIQPILSKGNHHSLQTVKLAIRYHLGGEFVRRKDYKRAVKNPEPDSRLINIRSRQCDIRTRVTTAPLGLGCTPADNLPYLLIHFNNPANNGRGVKNEISAHLVCQPC